MKTILRTLLITVVAVFVGAALSACQLLIAGVFPASLGQVVARANFSSSIASVSGAAFNLQVISVGGSEYVLLFSSAAFDPARTHLVVMDSDLKVLNSYTNNDMMTLFGVPFSGRFALVDVAGLVAVGNVLFSASPGGFNRISVIPPSGVFPFVASLDKPSVTGMPSFNFEETNFVVNGANFEYTEYGSGWGDPTLNPSSTPLGVPNPAPQGQLNVSGVFTDQASAATPDIVVFNDNRGRSYFLQIPKADIDADMVTVLPDLFAYAAANYPPLFVKTDLESQTITFSQDGIIAYDHHSEALVQFTLAYPDSVSSLPLKWVSGMRVAAGITGGSCVVWDPSTRVLSRYVRWW